MDFHRSFQNALQGMSAEELQTLRRKLTQAQMPCRSGPKDSVADGSDEQAERLQDQLEALEEVLSEERILRKGNISVGKWNEERKLVEILVAKGVHWNVFGKSMQGHLVLEPDEALYMLDHGMLELFHNDFPVSVQQAYELLLSDGFPLHHYVVYSYLRNLGFIVFPYERGRENVTKHTKDRQGEEIGVNVDNESLEKSMEIDREVENIMDTKEIYERGVLKQGFEDNVGKIEGKIDEVIGKTLKESMDVKNVEDVKGISKETKVENHEKTTGQVEDVVEGQSGELKGSMEESQVKKIEERQVERECKMVENENNPVLHYWKDEECQPLVHPSDATSLENILNKLQVIQGQTRQEASSQHTNTQCKFQITYDVFQPQKNFRKSDRGLPNHSICVCKFSEPPPMIGEMNFMASQTHPVPLKYAVVDGRDVSFYSILDVQLPTYVER